MLRAFPMPLTGAAIRWLGNEPSGSITSWETLKMKFLNKHYPPARTTKKMEEFNNFQQKPDESLFRAWEGFNELLMKASVSVMPLSTYSNLGLGDLAHTRLTIELDDRTIKHPRGIAENMLVRIGKFIFPIYFVILDISEDDDVLLILGRPFLSIAHAKIDVFKRKITLRVREEKLVFKRIKPATSIIRKVYMVNETPDFINQPAYKSCFSITDNINITSGVVLGMPFCKKFVSFQKIMERFAHGDKCRRMDE
nr:hypothetical protein [Tanacetum cinerariifolium]